MEIETNAMSATFPKHGAVYAKELAGDLLDQGYSVGQVFSGSGLSRSELEPDKPVAEIDRIAGFFEHAARLTNDDTLGFVRGQSRDMRRSGLISYVGMSSPTVMNFIQNTARYRRVFSDAVEIGCDTLSADGMLQWHFSIPATVKRRQFVEFGASGLMRALRQATGREFCPKLVTFRHPRNANTGYFTRYFGCDVRFGVKENAFYFRSVDLALPLVTADGELYKILQQCCENSLQTKSRNVPPLVVSVERAISDRLTKGEATQDHVARALGMSPRTLSRKLADNGTTFFKTLEGLRKVLAKHYLRDSSLVTAEIGYLLGYSTSSSFSGAFKRWTGKSPSQHRSTVRVAESKP